MNLDNKENLKKIELVANNIKTLALDAITYANSGHPGIVLSAANILAVLFQNHLNLDPTNLKMFNRDRFILEPGHGSALIYSTMVVFGYDGIDLDDMKKFRRLNSKTPGHPEITTTLGIEYTTGPLGQGIIASVGMGIAENHLASLYNKDNNNLIDHYTYCLISDGGFEEGISYESFSIAAKYKLNKLIYLYDSNNIQLDGTVKSNTITNTKQYFESLGLNYILVEDGSNFVDIDNAIIKAKQSKDKPTVIEFKTILGKDSIYENTNKIHGTALSTNELLQYKEKINWKYDPFTLSAEVVDITKEFKDRGIKKTIEFQSNLDFLKNKYPLLFQNFIDQIDMNFNFDENWFSEIIKNSLNKNLATRDLSGILLQEIIRNNSGIMITNPDISGSTKIKDYSNLNYDSTTPMNINIQVGVREFAAEGIINGLVAHKAIKGITSAFLNFSDYSKAALRIAALSNLSIINFYSHDSIFVGEDGPTHEPIEQISSLRLIPNHNVYRPCNIYELIEALKFAITNKNTPTSIITSRQKFMNHISNNLDDIKYGGYIFKDEYDPNIILITTGSEIQVTYEVADILKKEYNIKSKIVSMNSTFIFDKQTKEYKNKVLSLNKDYIFSIEFASTNFWYKYSNHPIGINEFGRSGSPQDVMSFFSLDKYSIAKTIYEIYNNISK